MNHRYFAVLCLLLALGVPVSVAQDGDQGLTADDSFVNPIAEGADPSVVQDGDRYLWVQSEGNRGIAIWESHSLTTLGRKHVVWRAPKSGPCSREVWAPEIVKLDDRWCIYFAASDGQNINHRTYVLVSKSSDPTGEYDLHGPLYTGDDFENKRQNIWAIDMVVLEHHGKRYAIWSGWTTPDSDVQKLYIAPMKSPTELSGPRVELTDNDDYLWERVEEREGTRGLHEGPQVLQRADRTFLVYSCAASWLPTYKLGLLELVGSDPLDPQSWKKDPLPLFRSTEQTFGVGHGGFVRSADRSQWWHVFHAKRDRNPGWRRSIYVQPMSWTEDGFPVLGSPVKAGTPIRRPAGETVQPIDKPRRFDFGANETLDAADYYGHHQLMRFSDAGVEIGVAAENVVNGYRCGEKILLRDTRYGDLDLTAEFSFVGGDRDAGILFRVSSPAVGFDAQRGYFAGLIPGRERIILGKMDGQNWQHLADAAAKIDRDQPQTLRVRAVGEQIEVFANDSAEPLIVHRDSDYSSGAIGVRVVDTHALFRSLDVRPIK